MVWEELKQNHGGYLYRSKVPNGWLVKEVQDTGSYDQNARLVDGYYWTSSITFVPDPEHSWEVELCQN